MLVLSHEFDLGLSESSEEDDGDREPFLGEALLGFPVPVQVPFSAVRLQ